MATKTALRIDMAQVEALTGKIGKLEPAELGSNLVSAINEVADRAYDFARKRMTDSVNLTDDYVRRKMVVQAATAQRPEARITASGAREDMTVLGRYDAKMILAPRKTTNRARPTTGGLRIPSGMRQNGVEVKVRKTGGDSEIEYGFLQPLRAGKTDGGNGLGVFARSKSGVKRHRYGPAVYQLFRTQMPNIKDDVGEDLQRTVGDAAEANLREILS